MLVIVTALLFLLGAPALLLWLGRVIERVTGSRPGRSGAVLDLAPQTDGNEWFYRPAKPIFEGGPWPAIRLVRVPVEPVRNDALVNPPSSGAWFYRPMKPLAFLPDWSRFRFRLALGRDEREAYK